ncbi:MAG: MBOAT family protein [Oscillospiraceae bacterium]|nr:MBOAT family protein [Oscillospiraceae bacterium]
MVFADLLFIFIFLPVCLFCYFFTKNLTIRNIVLIVFSLIFYAWGEPVWVILLVLSSAVDYFAGRIIGTLKNVPAKNAKDKSKFNARAKGVLTAAIAINIGILVLFKYSGFITETINFLTGLALPVPEFRLPIGISFYTFQTMSYSIGVYSGKVNVQKSFYRFLMYVTLFPQLIAGPIVRYEDVEAEINYRVSTLDDISTGIHRFVVGLAKKVIFANAAGKLAEQYLDGNLTVLSVSGAWFGIFMFAIQIFFDFSGYSDMAIGMGRIFGFKFKENFNYPYISRSITEFWRRWHISLSSFFRDYVYIPLGGNRKHQYLNLLVVWFLTGLWHGASWNFVLWGLYFFIFICIERLFLHKLFEKLPKCLNFIGNIYSLLVILVGWQLFYFEDFSKLTTHLKIMFFIGDAPVADAALGVVFYNNLFWIIAAVICCTPVTVLFDKFIQKHPKLETPAMPVKTLLYVSIFLVSIVLLVGQSYNPFLYWRF